MSLTKFARSNGDAGIPHPVDVHVGSKLRERRTLMGMTQEALGEAVGLTFQQIQKYEKGMNRVSASRLFAMAQILHTDVNYFFEGAPIEDKHHQCLSPSIRSDEDDGSKRTRDKMMRRETLELVRAYYGIRGETVRRRVFDMIKALSRGADQGSA